jgi:vancomycin resistance protein YoaR
MTTLTMPRRLIAPVASRSARRSAGLGLATGLAVGALALVGGSLAIGAATAGVVMPGVRVAGVELAGLDAADARARLAAALPTIRDGTLTVRVADVEASASFAEIGRDYDYSAMVDAALAVGRSGDPMQDGVERLRTLALPTDVPLVVQPYDPAALATFTATLSELATVEPVDAGADRDGARFSVSPAVEGRTVDAAAVESTIAAALSTPTAADATLVVEPVVAEPAVSSRDALHAVRAAERTAAQLQLTAPGADEELREALKVSGESVASWITFGTVGGEYGVVIDRAAVGTAVAELAEVVDREPADAGFTVEGAGLGEVIPSQDGRTLQAEESTDAIVAALEGRANGFATASLALEVTTEEPSLTTAEAEAALPKMEMVSAWTTNYVPGIANGWGANISIPAGDIDGTTVAPGEWFSFWDSLGPITLERGYTYGGAIINGRTEPTGALAGGICSTSTTVFNAAMRLGLEIGDRENHSYYIDRYPVGLDATVIKGDGFEQDMTFRNDTDAPLVIRGFGSPGRVTFELWSVPNGRRVVLSDPHITDRRSAIDTTQVDPSLAPGEARRIESPHHGFNVTVSRTVYDADGEVLHQDTWFSDYRAVNGVVLVGPSASASAPADDGETTTGDGGGGVVDEP